MKLIYFYLLLTLFLFVGCASSQNKVEEFFQTDNATNLKKDYVAIINILQKYKIKLDKRNPQNYDKQLSYRIYDELKNSTNALFLKEDGKYIDNFQDYLKLAFSTQDIKNRNDYLILGLYKQIYQAYDKNKGSKITAFGYDSKKLKALYYTLSVVNWKIQDKRNENGEYLYLTWQNNWQVELHKRLLNGEKPSWKLLQDLDYIKNKKETLFSSSNMNFEALMREMLYRVKNSLELLGQEPLDVSLEAMKSLILFL